MCVTRVTSSWGLFVIGAVVVHELSRDIIERALGEAMVPNLVSNGLVQLVFLRSMNGGFSLSRESEKSEAVSFANVSKAADDAQDAISSRALTPQGIDCLLNWGFSPKMQQIVFYSGLGFCFL